MRVQTQRVSAAQRSGAHLSLAYTVMVSGLMRKVAPPDVPTAITGSSSGCKGMHRTKTGQSGRRDPLKRLPPPNRIFRLANCSPDAATLPSGCRHPAALML